MSPLYLPFLGSGTQHSAFLLVTIASQLDGEDGGERETGGEKEDGEMQVESTSIKCSAVEDLNAVNEKRQRSSSSKEK